MTHKLGVRWRGSHRQLLVQILLSSFKLDSIQTLNFKEPIGWIVRCPASVRSSIRTNEKRSLWKTFSEAVPIVRWSSSSHTRHKCRFRPHFDASKTIAISIGNLKLATSNHLIVRSPENSLRLRWIVRVELSLGLKTFTWKQPPKTNLQSTVSVTGCR